MIGGGSKWIRRAEALAVIVLVGVVVVAVTHALRSNGSQPSAQTSATTSTTSSAPPTAASGPPTGSSGGGQPVSSALPQLQQAASSAVHTAFKATYKARGAPDTITIAQDGSKTSLTAGTTVYYTDGSTNTVCDYSTAPPSCYTSITTLTGPLSLVIPAQSSTAIQAAAAQGAGASYSTERDNGQLSSCISFTKDGLRVKYCMNSQGIVTFIKIPEGAFDLTDYSTAVSPGDVSVPTNATFRPAPPVP